MIKQVWDSALVATMVTLWGHRNLIFHEDKTTNFNLCTGTIRRMIRAAAVLLIVKINCDGSALGNPWPAGISSTFRVASGDFLLVMWRKIGVNTNYMAKCLAIVESLEIAVQRNQVLTVNQVVEILLRFLETRDWKTSFFQVIPQIKRCEAEVEVQDTEDADIEPKKKCTKRSSYAETEVQETEGSDV
ncbi:hypothetical protein IFM89_022651 [Coptis chinensis]|uniref:SAM-dependent MTase TRM10-type domain-containing protein n=1 Tax=Coptis chinensis TaxID=261450 RepID=A0A835GYU1_9MAGN|nr:hypothetical protein IFM89_022651 [Coptis chinensis]